MKSLRTYLLMVGLCVSIPALLPVFASTEPLDYREQIVDLGGKDQKVRVPSGYRLELLTNDLDGPRLLSFADNGVLFIGSKSGNIYRLEPPYTQPEVLVNLDDYPHAVAFRKGEILIARTSGLYRATYTPDQKTLSSSAVRLFAPLPGDGGHDSRTVGVGPDDRVYVSLGIQGNCSDQYLDEAYAFDDHRGGILVLDESSNKVILRPYASGLRNPVGFDWHPETVMMYTSNNGPDHLGYEQPPEYFSRIEPGSFHGMPWFQFDGRGLMRDQCIRRHPPRPLSEVSVPVALFPARNAPMAVGFVPEGAMDTRLENDAIVALHGSWAKKKRGGPATRRHPAIVVVRFSDGVAGRVDDLITGFQGDDGTRWARPVGVAIGPDGALYFTSDGGDVQGLFRLGRE